MRLRRSVRLTKGSSFLIYHSGVPPRLALPPPVMAKLCRCKDTPRSADAENRIALPQPSTVPLCLAAANRGAAKPLLRYSLPRRSISVPRIAAPQRSNARLFFASALPLPAPLLRRTVRPRFSVQPHCFAIHCHCLVEAMLCPSHSLPSTAPPSPCYSLPLPTSLCLS